MQLTGMVRLILRGELPGAGQPQLLDTIEAVLERHMSKRVPMKIGGATAAVHGGLGLPPPLARGPGLPVTLGRNSRPRLRATAQERAEQGLAALVSLGL